MIGLIINDIAANHHFQSIEVELRKRISKIVKKGININEKKVFPCGNFRHLLKWLVTAQHLKDFITARPKRILAINRLLRKSFPDMFDNQTDCHYVVYNIFVSSIYNKSDRFDKMEFIKQVGLDTCPYCNRNYTYYIDKNYTVKPQIDHFFPKETYPFLGICFYNLIPSCELCNGFQCKHDKDPEAEGLVNPYLLLDSDFKFTYDVLSSSILNSLLDRKSIQIRLETNIIGHLGVFKLTGLYEKHADHVLELILKSKVKYSTEYRKYLKSYSEKGLVLSDHEIDKMILGNYATQSQAQLRPLARLYQDIGRELGLIE